MDKRKSVKIFWEDAVIYGKEPRRLKLAERMTTGKLVKTTPAYVVVKDPVTSSYSAANHIYVPETDSRYTFFFIPRGMITRIVYKKENR